MSIQPVKRPPNPGGTPANLVASHPANAHNERNHVFSARLREPRAREVAESLLSLPHVIDADDLAAVEVGRLEALVEALDTEILRTGMSGETQRVDMLLTLRLRASGRLMEALDRFGGTPLARAKWARELAEGENLAQSIQRKRAAREVGP